MKIKILKKIRKNYDIVSRIENIKLDGSSKVYQIYRFIHACFEQTDLYKSIIDKKEKEIKDYFEKWKEDTKELSVECYKVVKDGKILYTLYVFGGICMPYYDYKKSNVFGFHDDYFDFDFNHLVRVCIYYEYLYNSLIFIENYTTKSLKDYLRKNLQPKKEKRIKKKLEEKYLEIFKKVWYERV